MSQFGGSPIAPEGSTDSVPLTTWQKIKLLLECIPFIFFVVMLVLSLTIFNDMMGRATNGFLPIFLGLVTLVMGFIAVQRLRDLLSGVALVKVDMMDRSWRTRSRSGGFYGRFEQLGRMRMTAKAHGQSRNNSRHRVTYSPISKLIWTAEPLDS